MAHYFFDLHECGSVTRDLEGRDFPTQAAAHDAAIEDARAIMCEELDNGALSMSCHIDILDADRNRVERVLFSDAVELRT